MTDEQTLRRALREAVPPPDPRRAGEEELWAASRRRRAGRHTLAATGAALAAVTALTLALQLADQPGPDRVTAPAASDPTAPEPDVDVPEPVLDPAQLLVRCADDQGFVIEITDGRWRVGAPHTQADARPYVQACADALGAPLAVLTGAGGTGVSSEEAATVYDDYLPIVRCLGTRELPTSGPPPRDEFVSALTRGHLVWHPYAAALEDDRLKEAMTRCPLVDSEVWRTNPAPGGR